MGREVRLLVSCEHGGNRIPARYRPLFAEYRAALESHAGYDVGALALARDLADAFAAARSTTLLYSTTSRLLVDLNRSVGHPRLHGEAVRRLAPSARQEIVAGYHAPYRQRAQRWVQCAVAAGARVVHVSCHSFTPTLNGTVRDADIGLLFDPQRDAEVRLVTAWRAALRRACPALRVRLNFPYRGTADGLTTTLRRRFDSADYAGIELEVNQLHPLGSARRWLALRRCLVDALREALTGDLPLRAPGGATKRAIGGMEGPA